MTFPIPVFPTLCDKWTWPNTPGTGAANVVNVPAQLYCSPHGMQPWFHQLKPATAPYYVEHDLLALIKVAPGTLTVVANDILQPDNTVAEYFMVRYYYRFYAGFPQEFFGMWCYRCTNLGNELFVY